MDVAGGAKAATFDIPASVPASGGLTPVARWPTGAALYGAIGIAAVVVLGLIWLIFGGGPAIPPRPASVLIDIRPWAAIQKVTNASSGEAVVVDCPSTPCVVSLPPGQYHVQANNPFFPQGIEFDVTVTGSEYQQVRQALPQFDPEEEARRVLGGR
jgi:hypothetical protein